MSERDGLDWHFYLDDMIAFAEKALAYTESLDRAGFLADVRTYDATLRNLELIGEAATHIPESFREQCPHIPWRQVIATRTRPIHGYLGIDDDTRWSIVQDDVPDLVRELRLARASLSDNPS